MKLVIVEGTDRTGKDTLVKSLVNWSDSTVVRHWGFPLGNTNAEKIAYQHHSFKKEFDLYKTLQSDTYFHGKENDTMIWNRSHLGEVVYGTLYREYDPSWVYNLEALYAFDRDTEVTLVLLEADAEFVCARDDGQSFTAQVDKKQKEIDLFNQAFERSIIQNKIKLKVNDGSNYRDAREIVRRVLELVEHQQQIS